MTESEAEEAMRGCVASALAMILAAILFAMWHQVASLTTRVDGLERDVAARRKAY